MNAQKSIPMLHVLKLMLASLVVFALPSVAAAEPIRVRDICVVPGILPPGQYNAITDVKGVRVGHYTMHRGERFHTGVTAIIPAPGNLRQDKVPAAVHIANGYGKLAGISQIVELGEIETPIALTNTLNVGEGVAALVEWTLEQDGNEDIRSVHAVVGETNDGYLNDIRARGLKKHHFRKAIEAAESGPVEEGNVGAGAGTIAFGWKGGIGSSSRGLPEAVGGWTVGVLVQANFGGVFSLDGAPIGQFLQQHYLRNTLQQDPSADGSIMVVVATDAPLSDRNLERLAKRAIVGLARTGATISDGSGDYVIAFSSNPSVRRVNDIPPANASELSNRKMSPLFQAVAEATEEAIYNAMFMAEDVAGYKGTISAIPVEQVRALIAQKNYDSCE